MDRSLESSEAEYVDLDCMIYVDAIEFRDVLSCLQGSLAGASMSNGILALPGVRVYGAHNDYEMGGGVAEGDFSQWPSVLECEPVGEISLESMVTSISVILRTLWGSQFRAVAACDYEDQLPERGGLLLFSRK